MVMCPCKWLRAGSGSLRCGAVERWKSYPVSEAEREERFVHRLSQEQKDPSSASELIHPSTTKLLCCFELSREGFEGPGVDLELFGRGREDSKNTQTHRAWSNQLANLRGSERNWRRLRSPKSVFCVFLIEISVILSSL
ncbi:unnamed protein product [Linum trigynum]|uniref:Uncharacterized protein n=1 Tax=Linum trigynum TaxID=586398 RepID=A0AAV2ESB4_9ROSI